MEKSSIYQFESFLMPVMVMMILPVAFTGALFALPLTGRDLSMMALVAIIMLAGTVANSSIILIEYIKIRRDMGESREEANLHACPLRVRPIMMTTLTTVLAMVPMALGIGGTNEMMSDMGVVMISGMVISTIVTLVFTRSIIPSWIIFPINFGGSARASAAVQWKIRGL